MLYCVGYVSVVSSTPFPLRSFSFGPAVYPRGGGYRVSLSLTISTRHRDSTPGPPPQRLALPVNQVSLVILCCRYRPFFVSRLHALSSSFNPRHWIFFLSIFPFLRLRGLLGSCQKEDVDENSTPIHLFLSSWCDRHELHPAVPPSRLAHAIRPRSSAEVVYL